MKTPAEIRAAALAYASRGERVFPGDWDKHPLTPHGYKDSTDDPAKVAEYWDRHPAAAICIDCGGSGLLVVDLDVKHGANGIETWRKLNIDSTYALKATTPSGGLHIYYRAPEGKQIGCSTGKLGPGIDIRANGGYVIAPPSHITTGDYVALGNWDVLPDVAPGKLVALLDKPEKPIPTAPSRLGPGMPLGDRGESWLKYYIGRAHPGCRNVMGFNLAVQLKAEGLSLNQAMPLMIRYSQSVPGGGDTYTADEALKSLKSAYQKGPIEPARQNG